MLLFTLVLITITFLFVAFQDIETGFTGIYQEQQKAIAGKLAHKAAIKLGTPMDYWYQYDGDYERMYYKVYKVELEKRLISYELRNYLV